MSTVILFHHVLGLTPGVRALADTLAQAGHVVTAPDLFDGRTFTDLGAGLAHVAELGDDELLARAERACAGLGDDVVLAGLSLGVVPAQQLLQTRPARGALLLHSFLPPAQLPGSWPSCPVHVFAADHDPFFVDDGDLAAAQAWGADHSNLHLHLYPGHTHLFLEKGHPDHDEAIAGQAVDDLLATLDQM